MVKSRFLHALTLAFSLGLSSAYGRGGCGELLKGEKPREGEESTLALKAYLKDLLAHRAIEVGELEKFIEGLERGELVNPISERTTWVEAEAFVHRAGLQRYLNDAAALDREELLGWSRRILKEEQLIRAQRKVVRGETRDLYRKIKLHPVRAGRFQMGGGRNRVEVEFTNAFEVMSTPLTQKQWAEIMGENPSYFKEGEHFVALNIDGKSIKMRPDHPVERVSWWSALEFANRLSEKHGLKPVYDLSKVKWVEGTHPENGTLEADAGKVEVDAPKGDIYKTEGYRLPTEAEQEYVLRAAGTMGSREDFRDVRSELEKYAWYEINSNGQTQPVGELLPLIIDGKAFHDLLGNVWEWSWDKWDDALRGGVNPVNAPKRVSWGRRFRCVRGGGWGGAAENVSSLHRMWDNGNGRYNNVGFRLVRTILN